MKPYQLSFPELGSFQNALVSSAESSDEAERGAIFTRGEVVDFILDLVGYTVEKPLHKMRLLEPSVGQGDFLIPVIKRLLKSWRLHSQYESPDIVLSNAILSVELHGETYDAVCNNVFVLLVEEGIENDQARTLVYRWLYQGDFLLADITGSFDFIVGNPPYVRQELIPDILMKEYRLRYQSIYDRADLYIPFIERSLALLQEKGLLGFICADRWMKNRYGGPLRKFISDHYHLKFYVDMVDTEAFLSEVSAYPAITVFTPIREKSTRIAHRPKIDKDELKKLASMLTSDHISDKESSITEVEGIVAGAEPWILEAPDQLALVRKLESKYPLIEEVGCKVGIGVATGLDKVFIGKFDEFDIESDRKLPLVMTRDIKGGSVSWRGLGVINPFNSDGKLVDLDEYPRLKKYLDERKQLIIKRHVASKNPNNWYRTIDRIYPEIATQPKLLIPDIKGKAHVIYEDGKLYPHHNLYYITSNTWDLRALQAVLQSGIARLFVSIYSTKIRGGYFRFQAQYLRRIRIPHWKDVPDEIKEELLDAAKRDDRLTCSAVVFKLYALSKAERTTIGGNGG